MQTVHVSDTVNRGIKYTNMFSCMSACPIKFITCGIFMDKKGEMICESREIGLILLLSSELRQPANV